MGIVLPLLLLLLQCIPAHSTSHFCPEYVQVSKTSTSECVNFFSKMFDGWTLNMTASQLHDEEEVKKVTSANTAEDKSRLCTFDKVEDEVRHVCCEGYGGSSCDIPICDPSCQHGVCIGPNDCKCNSLMNGRLCDEHSIVANDSLHYCFKQEECSGEKVDGFLGLTIPRDQCCGIVKGGSWGRSGGTCAPCPKQEEEPQSGHHHCTSFGRSLFITFDGKLFDFTGGCTYNMASEALNNWFIYLTVRDCDNSFRFQDCKKYLLIHAVGVDIEVRENKVYVEHSLVDIPEGTPAKLPDIKGVSVFLADEMLTLTTTFFSVKTDGKSFVQIHIDDVFDRKMTGLCGNANGITGDDVVGEWHEFGNSQEIILPQSPKCVGAGHIPESYCTTEDESMNAAVQCNIIYTVPIIGTTTSKVSSQDFHKTCMELHCSGKDDEDREEARCKTVEAYVSEVATTSETGSWRSRYVCPKTCKPGEVYSQAMPTSERSCSNLYNDLTTQSGEFRPGCECMTGRVRDYNRTCISPLDCRCVYYGKYYKPGQTVMKDCNECVCKNGHFMCTERECSSECSIIGTNHVFTFDGFHYDFDTGDAACEYTLTQTTEEAVLAGEHYLQVSMSIGKCQDRNGRCIQNIIIRTNSTTLKLMSTTNGNNGDVYIDENLVELPHSGEFFVKWATSRALFVAGYGFSLTYDGDQTIYLEVGPHYENKVRGICGNFNKKNSDDLEVNGVIEPDAARLAFGYAKPSCRQLVEFIDPCADQPKLKDEAETFCSHLQENEFLGVAREFLTGSLLDAPYFYQRCVWDMCSNIDDVRGMCTWTSALVRVITSFSHSANWTYNNNTKLCADTVNSCDEHGKGSKYSDCISRCKTSCRDFQIEENGCEEGCVYGCHCPAGQYLDDYETCVPIEKCTCYDELNGETIRAGVEVHRGCESCTCLNGTLDCVTHFGCDEDVTCPENQIYIAGYKCPHTCLSYDKNNPNECPVKLPRSGCGCADDLVISHNDTCIPYDSCSCFHVDRYYDVGEIITVNCKVLRCEGRSWSVLHEEECLAMCAATGDPHYKTFDNRYYSFQGTCQYTFVKSDEFEIAVSNVPCGTKGVTCTKHVVVSFPNVEMKFVKGQPVGANSELTNQYEAYDVKVFENGEQFTVIAWNGVFIKIDRGTRVYVFLTKAWKYRVEGLCGNFDDNSKNDFGTLGSGDSLLMEFVNSLKKDSTCPDVDVDDVASVSCDSADPRKPWSMEQCSVIKKPGIFGECIKHLSQAEIDYFYNKCEVDACSCDSGGDCECLCEAVADFAEYCNSIGVCVRWRSKNFCPMQCDYGLTYQACGDRAPQTCKNQGPDRDTLYDPLPPNEGCFCPNGYFKEGNGCKPVSECECTVNGISYPPGFNYTYDCQECVCVDGNFDCDGEKCKPCDVDEFQCKDGQCINGTQRCDGNLECFDGTDEENCTCDIGQVQCADLIGCGYRCNKVEDCHDGSDEQNCTICNIDEFQCNDGSCIEINDLCNYECDCGEGIDCTDEMNCLSTTVTTTSTETTSVSSTSTSTMSTRTASTPTVSSSTASTPTESTTTASTPTQSTTTASTPTQSTTTASTQTESTTTASTPTQSTTTASTPTESTTTASTPTQSTSTASTPIESTTTASTSTQSTTTASTPTQSTITASTPTQSTTTASTQTESTTTASTPTESSTTASTSTQSTTTTSTSTQSTTTASTTTQSTTTASTPTESTSTSSSPTVTTSTGSTPTEFTSTTSTPTESTSTASTPSTSVRTSSTSTTPSVTSSTSSAATTGTTPTYQCQDYDAMSTSNLVEPQSITINGQTANTEEAEQLRSTSNSTYQTSANITVIHITFKEPVQVGSVQLPQSSSVKQYTVTFPDTNIPEKTGSADETVRYQYAVVQTVIIKIFKDSAVPYQNNEVQFQLKITVCYECEEENIGMKPLYVTATSGNTENTHTFKNDEIFADNNALLAFSNTMYKFLTLKLEDERRVSQLKIKVSDDVYAAQIVFLRQNVVVYDNTITVNGFIELFFPEGTPSQEIRVYFHAFTDFFYVGNIRITACKETGTSTSSTSTTSVTYPTTTSSSTTSVTSPTTTSSSTTSVTSPTTTASSTTSVTSPTTTVSLTTSVSSPTTTASSTSVTSPTTTVSSTTSVISPTTLASSTTSVTSPTTTTSSTTSVTSPTTTASSTTSVTSPTPTASSTTSVTTHTPTASSTTTLTSPTTTPPTTEFSTTFSTTAQPPCQMINGMTKPFVVPNEQIKIKALPEDSVLAKKLHSANATELDAILNSLRYQYSYINICCILDLHI